MILRLALFLLLGAPQERPFEAGSEGRASLRLQEGVPVLHVYGTPDQMGAQYGKLLKKAIAASHREVGRKFLDAAGGAPAEKRLRAETRGMEAAVPAHVLGEMKAAARAAGLGYDEALLFNTMFDVEHGGKRLGGCCTAAASGAASGEPVLGRNFDLPQPFWGLSPLGVVAVRHGERKHAFAAVTHPLFFGTHAGMNEKGLAVGATAGTPGLGYDPAGISPMILFRKVLEDAATAAEAERILKDARVTVATTLMAVDARGEIVLAELAPRRVAFRRPERNTLHATNHFVSAELAQKVDCPRFRFLEENFKGKTGIDEAFMKKVLAGSAPGTNLQSMIFFPARRTMLLSSGSIPAARGTFTTLDAKTLFP